MSSQSYRARKNKRLPSDDFYFPPLLLVGLSFTHKIQAGRREIWGANEFFETAFFLAGSFLPLMREKSFLTLGLKGQKAFACSTIERLKFYSQLLSSSRVVGGTQGIPRIAQYICVMSSNRCSPRQITVAPGSPSLLRPRKPPSVIAIKRTNSRSFGGWTGGSCRVAYIIRACHCASSKYTVQGKSGTSRPNLVKCAIRQATTRSIARQASMRSALPNCRSSIWQPLLSTR